MVSDKYDSTYKRINCYLSRCRKSQEVFSEKQREQLRVFLCAEGGNIILGFIIVGVSSGNTLVRSQINVN